MKAGQKIVLHGFWLSSCTWRVRAALHFKGMEFKEKNVDILKEQKQLTEEYRRINPSQKVPALEIDGNILTESMAILQYLDETRPSPPLAPDTILMKARMRGIVDTIVSGIQPLQNMGLRKHFNSPDEFKKFSTYWTVRGLESLEDLFVHSAGKYCVGDHMSMADLCLVPQVYNAIQRCSVDISKYPNVSRLYSNLMENELFISTHPKKIKIKN